MNEQLQVAVVGAGIMGSGIAQVSATAGHRVILHDLDEAILARAVGNIEKSLTRLVKAGNLDERETQRIHHRITTTTDLERAAGAADLVIEAVSEQLEVKLETFRRLDAIAPDHAILGSNTSQFSISELAAAVSEPGRVIGTHFFNPPAVMRLVEVIRAVQTADATLEAVLAYVRSLGKQAVVCQDSQGFITSRIIIATMLEALRIFDEGIATKEDIDQACRLGFNWPMGPFELMDFTGLDTSLSVAEAMASRYGDRFLPSQKLRNLVRAGFLGRKSGRGFYLHG